MYGLTMKEAEEQAALQDEIEVWPDNWIAVCVFCAIGTQWRVAFGPYGLDYNVLYRKLDRLELSPDEYDDVEGEIRVLESEALQEMHRQADAARKDKK
jgi:hypothetical protein